MTGLTLEEAVVIETAQTRWEVEGPAAGGLDGRGALRQLLVWLVSGPFMAAHPYPLNRFLDISLWGGFLGYGVPSHQSSVELPQDRSALVRNHTGDLRELAL